MKAYGLQGMGGGTGGAGVSNAGFSSGGTYGQYQVNNLTFFHYSSLII